MTQAILRDISGGAASRSLDLWEPVIITGEQIDAEVERLASIPPPANGRREAMIVHPRASAPGNGFTPGIGLVLGVLKPGETTAPIRHNSTQVNFCIRGSGCAEIGGNEVRYGKYDVWNTPSFRTYAHRNDGNDVQAQAVAQVLLHLSEFVLAQHSIVDEYAGQARFPVLAQCAVH